MSDEKDTRENLIKCAKEEFLEKGYLKASLRSICRKAGVTTGALYFFFEDKEDLFGQIVEKPIKLLLDVMLEHYEYERNINEDEIMCEDKGEQDKEAAYIIIKYLYKYYDEFQLVLTKSQGSRYEKFVDEITEVTEKHNKESADRLTNKYGKTPVDDYFIHWFSRMQIGTFVDFITHQKDEKSALNHIDEIIEFMYGGWKAILSYQ